MKVLSLFDGISCGRIALERAGIKVDRYIAFEIDDNAIKISKNNWNDIEHRGDVFNADFSEFEGFDLLIGGSPCTYWSVSRTPKTKDGVKRETTASGLGWDLFSNYVRALKDVKPKYFLYENNYSMSDDIRDCITECLGVNPIMIDSADFSAQKRKRYYWTNIDILPYEKSQLLFRDIMEHCDYDYFDISKYKDTFKYSTDGHKIKWDTSGKGYYSQQNRATKINNKWDTLCAARLGTKGNIWVDESTIRRLTILEAERLQTLPDGYTECIKSKENRGKVIGNGWTVDVIAHILRRIK